ncbi:MAG: hypothetical protein K2X32_02950 [Phycisphaerales bacterium]|nr:hypothetical protein [Phycisphaerales bacterium]
MNRVLLALVMMVLLAVGTAASCASRSRSDAEAKDASARSPARITPPSLADTKPVDFPGVHNLVAFHDGYISGSVPEGDAGFDSLKAMGVKTIISVDGATPEVARAEARGMKYIHLPIGYSGFDNERKMQLIRATRDAMAVGPVYIHCHHGKHRSAGAAATVAASLGWSTPEAGVARMKVSGTSPSYKGLYACVTRSDIVSAEEINAVSGEFPSVWKTTNFVKGMVEIDETFDHLREIERAGWKTPSDHPDLVPVAEAGRLADHFRVMGTTERVMSAPADFKRWIVQSERDAKAIEDLLLASAGKTEIAKADAAKLSASFKLISQSCKDCHVKYRD